MLLPSLPIRFIDVSSIANPRIIFLLRDSASPDLNKKAVFSSLIVSLDPPMLLAIIYISIDCASTATLPKASGSIEADTIISETL